MTALILNVSRRNFTDNVRNEIVGYTSTIVAIPKEQKENDLGYEVTKITGKIEHFDVIKRFVGKEVEVDVIYQKANDNTYKMKFSKISDIEL